MTGADYVDDPAFFANTPAEGEFMLIVFECFGLCVNVDKIRFKQDGAIFL